MLHVSSWGCCVLQAVVNNCESNHTPTIFNWLNSLANSTYNKLTIPVYFFSCPTCAFTGFFLILCQVTCRDEISFFVLVIAWEATLPNTYIHLYCRHYTARKNDFKIAKLPNFKDYLLHFLQHPKAKLWTGQILEQHVRVRVLPSLEDVKTHAYWWYYTCFYLSRILKLYATVVACLSNGLHRSFFLTLKLVRFQNTTWEVEELVERVRIMWHHFGAT